MGIIIPLSWETRISAFAMRKNNDKQQQWICLGFSYNSYVLDIIVRHNRPRKEKNAFRGKYGGDCVSTHSGEADCFAAKNFHLRRKFAAKNVF